MLEGSEGIALGVTGAATLGSVAVAGSATVGSLTASGVATLSSAEVTGDLEVAGMASVEMRRTVCMNTTPCTCPTGSLLVSGGAVGSTVSIQEAAAKAVYAARPKSTTTFEAFCAGTAGAVCGEVDIICARLGA